MCQGLVHTLILYSKEGVTQGDPLVMVLYGLGLLPFSRALSSRAPMARQFWYADDARVGAKLSFIREFWTHQYELGPRYRYCPEPTKNSASS